MFFRCPQCAGHTLVKPEEMDEAISLECVRCRRRHETPNFQTLGKTDREHYEKANELATVCEVELPSAYSILLGILTLKDARRLAEDGPPPNPRLTQESEAPLEELPAEPQTKPEARSVRRVQLPAPREKQTRYGPVILLLALVCLILGATTAVLWTELALVEPDAVEPPLPLRSVEMQTDRAGRVVKVSGPNPQTVVMAFCKIDATDTAYEPVEIFIPSESGVRFGILTDPTVPGSRFAIRIRRQDRASFWTAGDGAEGIPIEEPPPIPKGTATIPVNWDR